jgi:cation:H+ antiporter
LPPDIHHVLLPSLLIKLKRVGLPLDSTITLSLPAAFGVLVVCFAILTKCADWFVDGAVGIAEHFDVPKMLIGIVLVSLSTTAPELAVSINSAIQGFPEIALGNAIGSVIVDDTVAIGLAALVATSPILVDRHLLKTTGIFLVVADLVLYAMAWNGTLGRIEGGILLILFVGYTVYTYRTRWRAGEEADFEELADIEEAIAGKTLKTLVFWFVVGLVGVLVASHGIVEAGTVIATAFGISEAVIGLTLFAIGTSLPEIATGITAARRGHGEIVVGNILGADVLNVCWIAGASAVVNPLVVTSEFIHFSIPTMLFVVILMLVLMRTRHQLSKTEGVVLLVVYAIYLPLAAKYLL